MENIKDPSQEKQEILMPTYPDPFFDWSEEDNKNIKYNGDMLDIEERKKFKLFKLWVLWSAMINNQRLSDVCSEQEKNKNSDKYFLKYVIVNCMDQMAKILSNTMLTEELLNR